MVIEQPFLRLDFYDKICTMIAPKLNCSIFRPIAVLIVWNIY